MRKRRQRRNTHEAITLGCSLITLLTIFAAGCVYIPDFEHPSPNPDLDNPLKGSIIKKIPFSVTRTVTINKNGRTTADFLLEKEGRADWFAPGLGTTAKWWRFVVFAPDGSIICGNEWTSTEKVAFSCDLDQQYVASPVSADIDYTYENKKPTEPEDHFSSMGRIFYFIQNSSDGIVQPAPH